jgi:hypothetical protein
MKTPNMTPDTVEMVSVEWIMQNTTHSVDGYNAPIGVDYQKMMHGKCGDRGFGALVWNILHKGFRIPIVLDLAYQGEDTITHGNGHHRMCAAILLALDEIPVYWSENDYMATDYSTTGYDDNNYRDESEFPEKIELDWFREMFPGVNHWALDLEG